MANLFLGFPVPRAKIADMIASDAPPSLHKTQHQDGGTDEMDVTGLVGAGGMATLYEGPGIFVSDWFESLDGWVFDGGGGGTASVNGYRVLVQVNGTSDAWAELMKVPDIFRTMPNWNKKVYFKADVEIKRWAANSGRQWIIAGQEANRRHVGFKVTDGVLRGCVANGLSETLTTWSETLGAAAFTIKKSLECKYNVTSCSFYVDGVLVETLSTGLPEDNTDANYLFNLVCWDDVKAVAMYLQCSWFKVWKEV